MISGANEQKQQVLNIQLTSHAHPWLGKTESPPPWKLMWMQYPKNKTF